MLSVVLLRHNIKKGLARKNFYGVLLFMDFGFCKHLLLTDYGM